MLGIGTSRTTRRSSEAAASLQVGTIVFLTGLGSMLVAIGGFMCLFRVRGRLWPRSCHQDGIFRIIFAGRCEQQFWNQSARRQVH